MYLFVIVILSTVTFIHLFLHSCLLGIPFVFFSSTKTAICNGKHPLLYGSFCNTLKKNKNYSSLYSKFYFISIKIFSYEILILQCDVLILKYFNVMIPKDLRVNFKMNTDKYARIQYYFHLPQIILSDDFSIYIPLASENWHLLKWLLKLKVSE